MSPRPFPCFSGLGNCCHQLRYCVSYETCEFYAYHKLYKSQSSELSLDTYRSMLPNKVECPRCSKPGFLTLRWVRSNHYCKIEIPHHVTQWVWKEIPNPLVGKGQEPTIWVKRNLRRYAPVW